MIFGRKKTKCTVGPAPNPETVEFFFYGDHWSMFFPDVKGILQKGLKPCRWQEKSEGVISYEIGNDDVHHTLLCQNGEVHITDNNYGLWIFIAKRHEDLYRRVEEVLRTSGRFELVFEDNRGKNC